MEKGGWELTGVLTVCPNHWTTASLASTLLDCLAGIVVCAMTPSTQATGQTGLCKSEATLIYLLSSRLARGLHDERLSQKRERGGAVQLPA